MSDIPEDVVADILSRLPVKSLLRFRCVSNQWRALIGSVDFINLHLNRAKNNTTIIRKGCESLYSINLDSLDNAVTLNYRQLNLNEQSILATKIVGSCNGLLCLNNSEKYIFLWNPATRKYRKSPVSRVRLGFQFVAFGFGYDDVSDDYKVVRMVQFYEEDAKHSFRSEVSIYSMKPDSWRRIGDFPYYFTYERVSGVLASGALHWVVTRNRSSSENLIVAFDLRTEEYRLVPQPQYLDKKFHMNVDVLGGCLCVLCHVDLLYAEMWVMENYGVEKSWTKLISVAQAEVINSFDVLLPVAYSKSREQVLLLQDFRRFIWYDLTTKRVVNIEIDGMPYYYDSSVCFGSLVRLRGGIEGAGRSGKKFQKIGKLISP
ncbi:hypothetical protein LguiA_012593 [Lonicera macranthoides]